MLIDGEWMTAMSANLLKKFYKTWTMTVTRTWTSFWKVGTK